ncbi:MAG TPA: hypothetical protein VFI61_02765 [Patescibacteria group bacterium]|nr:hypothetical protein [Patescibacteria group bacterium]
MTENDSYIGAQIFKVYEGNSYSGNTIGEGKSQTFRIKGNMMTLLQNDDHLAIYGNIPNGYELIRHDDLGETKIKLLGYGELHNPNVQFEFRPIDNSEGEVLVINTIPLTER